MNFILEHVELKIIYVLFFANLATQTRFLVLYWEQLGITNTRIGVIAATQRTVAMLFTPVWGALSDRIGDRKRVLILLLSITAVVVPFQGVFDWQWLVQGRDIYHYLWFFVILQSTFSCASTSLWDALVLVHLKKDKVLYGKQRLFGAISWGLTYVALGWLVDVIGARVVLPFSIVTALPLIYFIMRKLPEEVGTGYDETIDRATENEPELGDEKRNNPNNRRLSDSETSETRDESPAPISEVSGEVRTDSRKRRRRRKIVTVAKVCHIIFQSRSSLTFFFVQFVIGGGMSVVENMLFIYLAHKFRATGFLMGLSVGMTVIFELPIFHFTEAIIQRVGCTWMLILGQLAFAIRVVGYTMVSSAWWILFLEPLHGVTFSLVQSASVFLVSGFASPGLESTAQTLTSTFRMGAGPAVFLLFSGYQMDNHGEDSLFILCGLAALISTSLYAYVWSKDNNRQERMVYSTVVELQTQDNEDGGTRVR